MASDHIGSCDTLTESMEYSAPSKEDSGLHDMTESPSVQTIEGELPSVCILPATPRVYDCDKNRLALTSENSEYGTVPRTVNTSGTSMFVAVHRSSTVVNNNCGTILL